MAAFIVRIIGALALIVVVVVLFLLTAYVIAYLINRGIQWGAELIGGEIGDLFKYLNTVLPKIRIERKTNDKKPESRETV